MTTADALHQATTYAVLIPKGAGLLDETRTLLDTWVPGETAAALADRVHRADLLGKTTATRARDIVKVFASRFLTPDDTPARHLQRIVAGNSPRQLFTDLVFFHAARRDALLRDFVVKTYWPAVREGRLVFSNQDAVDFIVAAERDGRISPPWSWTFKPRMAGSLLAALTDFGLLGPGGRGRREVLHYGPADGTIIYLAYLLHAAGVTDSYLAEHPTWELFGLQPVDVLNRLDALSGQGWFLVQRAGDVVRISWSNDSLEEVVDALVG